MCVCASGFLSRFLLKEVSTERVDVGAWNFFVWVLGFQVSGSLGFRFEGFGLMIV